MDDEQEQAPEDHFEYPENPDQAPPKKIPRDLAPTKKGYKSTNLYNRFSADRYLFFINYLLKKKGEYVSAVEFLREYDPELQHTPPKKTREQIKKLYAICQEVPPGRYLYNGKAWYLKVSSQLFSLEVAQQSVVRKEGKKFVILDQPDVSKAPDLYDPLNILFEVTAITRERVLVLLEEERNKIAAWHALTPEEKADNPLEGQMSGTLTRLVSDLSEYASAHHKGAIDRGFLSLVPKRTAVDTALRGSSDAYAKYIEATDSNAKMIGVLQGVSTRLVEGVVEDLKIEGDQDGQKAIQTEQKITPST